jgi:hypothetical protein
MTTYERTTRENDEEHERKPVSAIMQAIEQTSLVSDCDRSFSRLARRRGRWRGCKVGKRLRHHCAASKRMQALLRHTFHGDVGAPREHSAQSR